MMNDAMMQKKSIHTNTHISLTDYVRRALFMLLLVVVSGGAWGQISSFSKGVIDENNVADYTIIKYNYTENESYRIPDIRTQWNGYNGQNGSGQHWKDGSSTYFDCWNGTALITSQNYKTTTITLPKGRYVLLAPARAGATATVTMKINDNAQTPNESSISMSSTGDSGKGLPLEILVKVLRLQARLLLTQELSPITAKGVVGAISTFGLMLTTTGRP